MRSDDQTPLQYLKDRIADFARERAWEQFHSPKNLSMALAVEAAEVMELFQWKTEGETADLRHDPKTFRRVREEIADVAVYLLNLCNRLNIDLSIAILEKLSQNARKYPVDLAKGSAAKYTELLTAGRNALGHSLEGRAQQLELSLDEIVAGEKPVMADAMEVLRVP
jgi:NTP pyrophosphatase (non-canonical NTP hydrolase)